MIAFFFSPFHAIDEYNGHDPQRCYLDDVFHLQMQAASPPSSNSQKGIHKYYANRVAYRNV